MTLLSLSFEEFLLMGFTMIKPAGKRFQFYKNLTIITKKFYFWTF